jgi:hypothetical protein
MTREWRIQQVERHNKGITDDVENSSPDFQEECDNLVNQRRTHALGTRPGSQYLLNFLNNALEAPQKIRQLFLLEEYIFAYCYDDPALPSDDIDGRIYWILEDGTSSAWTEVTTVDYGSGNVPVFIKQGHVQASFWEGHLYLSLEPYDKSFSPNNLDRDVVDPDTFPPDDDRISLKKLYIDWESTTQIATPRCVNAQLPTSLIHPYVHSAANDGEYLDTPWDTGKDWYAPLYYHTLRFRARNDATGDWDTDDAEIRIVSDAGWGESLIDKVHFTYSITGSAGPLACVATLSGTVIDLAIDGTADTALYEFQELVDVINAALIALQATETSLKAVDHQVYIGENAEPTTKIKLSESSGLAGTKILNNFAGTAYREDGGYNGWGWYYPFKEGKNTATNNAPALYQYTFYAREEYTALVDGTPRTFLFEGPISQVQLGTNQQLGSAEVGAARNHRRAVPMIGAFSKVVEDTTNIWDWSRIKGVFARTELSGIESYVETTTTTWLDDIAGGGTSEMVVNNPSFFTSASAFKIFTYDYHERDSILRAGELVYFSGNQRFYTSLPRGPYHFDVVNQQGYYANILNLSTRVYQSLPSVPHATAFDFFIDLDEPVTALNHFLEKPIVCTDRTIWRLEGIKGRDGRGRLFSRVVSNEYGCIANQSVVRTNIGLFLWGRQGIIYTDGLRAIRVNEHILERYQTWLDNTRSSDDEIGARELRGSYNEIDQRIHWSALDSDGRPMWIILDLRQGVGPTMCFQTAKGDTLTANFGDSSGSNAQVTIPMFQTNSTLYSEETTRFYRAQDKRILLHTADLTYDEFYFDQALLNGIQTNYTYAGLDTTLKMPIKPFLKSIGFAYGSKSYRKWTSRVMINMRDTTQKGVSFQPLGWDDLGPTQHKLPSCLNYQHLPFSLDYATFPVQDVQQFFAHQDCQVNNDFIASFKRRFPKGHIRNTYKQFGLMELPIYSTRLLASEVNPTLFPAHNAIDVDYKNGTVDFVQITLNYENIANSIVTALSMTNGGVWYVKWPGEDDNFHKIEDIVTYTGGVSDVVIFTVSWPQANIALLEQNQVEYIDLAFVATDQPIELLDYSMSYTIIGDRTHGIYKGGPGAANGDS